VGAAIITLTTDFGTKSPYVAAMKGVLLASNPGANLIDLTHEVPPQNIRFASFFLAGALPFFPKPAVHLVVVDPGVGSSRAILCVDLDGCILVGPDNGFWCPLCQKLKAQPKVYRVDSQHWQLPRVSATFHGRDRMAPAAGRLSLGYAPESLGERTQAWVDLETSPPMFVGDEIRGEVVFVDGFGNLITNISSEDLKRIPTPVVIEIAGKTINEIKKTYSDVSPGTAIALISSFDLLEIAICQGSAELFLSAGVGACVVLRKKKLPT
jgi:S-adenosylmethionine hydrolase